MISGLQFKQWKFRDCKERYQGFNSCTLGLQFQRVTSGSLCIKLPILRSYMKMSHCRELNLSEAFRQLDMICPKRSVHFEALCGILNLLLDTERLSQSHMMRSQLENQWTLQAIPLPIYEIPRREQRTLM